MNLQWLYYFSVIAEEEHFTKAADKIHVSQSSLSHAMKDMEEELGVELFEKKGRNVKLTKYGEIFLPHVQKTLEDLHRGVSTLKQFIDPNEGTITFGGFQSVGQFSTDLMIRYQSETNRLGVKFQYRSDTWDHLKEDLLSGALDLIISTKIDSPQIGSTFLGTHCLIVLVPAKHPLAQRDSITFEELAKENLIAFDTRAEIRQQIDAKFKALGMTAHVVAETPNDLIAYSLVAAGHGLAVLAYPLAGAPYGTKIVRINDKSVPKRYLYLQWNKDRYMPPASEYFKNYVIRSEDVFDQYRARNKIKIY
jgi:DNA-binding transcriptional LysR family regulator